MKITRRIMLKLTVSMFCGLIAGLLPAKNPLFAQEKPIMPRAIVYKETEDLVDRLAKIAKDAGLKVSGSKKEALRKRLLEDNYKALSRYFILIDDP